MEVRTQQELLDALAAKEKYIYLIGGGYFDLSATGLSTVTARGNSTVTAWGNSTVTAWENSTVTAWENSTVTARGNSTVTATSWVAIHKLSPLVKITGGIVIEPPQLSTPQVWCDFYGIEVTDGVAIVFKGVMDDFHTSGSYRFAYLPGTTPTAPDWDGGKQECGKGLHFSPHPQMTLEFQSDAKRFLACPVALSDMSVHPDGTYPQKCKAKGLCAPCWEVDRNGNPIDSESAAKRKVR